MARGVASALLAAAAWAPLAAGLAAVAKKKERQDTVMALAAYNTDVAHFPLTFVNTLRATGFEGNIFLGMWEGTTDSTDYMKTNGVTPKYFRKAECKLRHELAPQVGGYMLRNVCTEDFPHLKLESARVLYARRWLQECPACDGWSLFADFDDVNFQLNPFALLPDVGSVPADTLYLTEEMFPRVDTEGRHRGVSTSHWMVKGAVERCYGQEAANEVADKPMINVATTIGTREGMSQYLGALEQEFDKNSQTSDCDPVNMPDQGTLNYVFYVKKAMPFAIPKRYGEWIVNTMGTPCSNEPGLQPDHSLTDIVIIDEEGRVWNEDGSLPGVIHQGKVCYLNYVTRFLRRLAAPFRPGGSASPEPAASRLRDVLPSMANAKFPGKK